MDMLKGSLPLAECMHEEVQRLLGFLSGSGHSLNYARFRQLLANPLFRLLIARDLSKPYAERFVGMASIIYTHKLGGTIAEIHDVVVDPACRGEGIGERLVRGLITDAERHAACIGNEIVISLTSRPSRVAANELYLKLGFELTARHLRKNKESFGTNLYRMTIIPSS
jgi:ribosomal protein S18 acetylase RimI-like enzyme